MNELNNVGFINKDTKTLISHIFYDKIIKLEKDIKFSKQLEINKTQEEILRFIYRNPNSKFEIRVLEREAKSVDDFKFLLSFKNYIETEARPNTYVIVLESSLCSVSYYVWSLNNILLSV